MFISGQTNGSLHVLFQTVIRSSCLGKKWGKVRNSSVVPARKWGDELEEELHVLPENRCTVCSCELFSAWTGSSHVPLFYHSTLCNTAISPSTFSFFKDAGLTMSQHLAVALSNFQGDCTFRYCIANYSGRWLTGEIQCKDLKSKSCYCFKYQCNLSRHDNVLRQALLLCSKRADLLILSALGNQ